MLNIPWPAWKKQMKLKPGIEDNIKGHRLGISSHPISGCHENRLSPGKLSQTPEPRLLQMLAVSPECLQEPPPTASFWPI